MSEELLQTITETEVTVDAATAAARGDNFVPTDDDGPALDNNGDSIDTPTPTAAAPAPAPAPAGAPAPAPDEAEELERDNGGRIPKARFNEVNNARKLAEERANLLAAEVERLKQPGAAPAPSPAPAPAPAAPAFDVKAQERAYADAMLEGDVDAALEIREKINTHLLTTARQEAVESMSASMSARQAEQALQEASNKAVSDYPYLNTADGAEALDFILMARDRGIASGKPAHVALQEAVAKIAPRFAPAGQTPASGLQPKTPALDTRSADALARGAADSNLQPPAIVNGIGNRATEGKLDVTKLTEAQFDALTPEEKKKARGD